MTTYKRPVLYFLSGLLTSAIVITGISLKKPEPGTTPVEVAPDGRPQYKWYAPSLPSSIDFCGEQTPLDRWDVREKLDRELLQNSYMHGTQLYTMKLMGRYLPAIEERLKENGVPGDFIYVCIAESALQQNALSGVGAASFWQFMKDTGPRYGLEINEEVDERFNVTKATDAACKYFKDAYTKFGTWTAAAASYNCGMQGYSNFAEFQQASNYYDLIFPDETNRYLYRILALKYILSHPRYFGLILEAGEEYRPLKFRTVEVTKSIENLTEFAKANNSSYKMLKIYNPWLRAHKLTVKPGKKYDIAFPL
jgi:membrane-bound lytic murein transglycosylase D